MWRKRLPTRRCLFDLLLSLTLAAGIGPAKPAAGVAAALKEASFDPDSCWRIRDFTLFREEVKLYLTDGYLVLSKPVAGEPIAALFVADVEGGDGELILLPPDAGERQSLARFTETPNLNEHFKSAFLLFTDATANELRAAVRDRSAKPAPEMGALLSEQFSSTLRNLSASFETRLIHDLAAEVRPEMGLFFAALSGSKLGNFDVVYDPQAGDQVVAGQIQFKENRSYYNIWTSFPTRKVRQDPTRALAETEFRIEHVNVDAEFGANLQLGARVTLHVRIPDSPGARRVRNVFGFDISRRVRILEAKVDGQPAQVLQRENLRSSLLRGNDNEMFLVTTEAALPPGMHTFEFRQEGDVVLPAGNGVFFVGARGTWYPQHGLQWATYDVTFRYPKTLTVVATGDLVDEREEGDVRITHRRSTVPLRLAGFNLGEYKRSSVSKNGLHVDVYANKSVEASLTASRQQVLLPPPPPAIPGPRGSRVLSPPLSSVFVQPPAPDPTQQLAHLASEVAEAFDFLSARLGPPPLKSLAVSPIPGTFGQGFPGLIYLSTLSYLPERDRPNFAADRFQRTFFSDILVAHEVAHQWWGNAVSTSGYRDEWIMEALANYSALLLLERKRGVKTVDEVLERYREHLSEKRDNGSSLDSAGPIRLGSRLESSANPGAYRALVYEKGTWIVHMLRKRMGDAAFFAFLREVHTRHARKRITTADFRSLAAAQMPAGHTDRTLEHFFAAYTESIGIPGLKLSAKWKGLKAEIEIEQSDVDADFSIDVPVEIDYGRGKTETRWVRTDGARTPVSWTLKAVPVKISLDPRNTVLATRN
ncbi:MAG: M1 family metallopeptidase [Acidobacteria bacterium]|nr:M1 family metallopeptidase [Acidobacteriota bacterium]